MIARRIIGEGAGGGVENVKSLGENNIMRVKE